MGDQEELAQLHDAYVWQVNAAVEEGRFDLVEELAEAHLDEALALLTADSAAACARPDCKVCGRRPAARPPSPRGGWRRWFGTTSRLR